MDENKAIKLREIGYMIRKCCGNCRKGIFTGRSSFGTCAEYQYNHIKHSVSTRDLSIHCTGYCDKHDLYAPDIHAFIEFMEK